MYTPHWAIQLASRNKSLRERNWSRERELKTAFRNLREQVTADIDMFASASSAPWPKIEEREDRISFVVSRGDKVRVVELNLESESIIWRKSDQQQYLDSMSLQIQLDGTYALPHKLSFISQVLLTPLLTDYPLPS